MEPQSSFEPHAGPVQPAETESRLASIPFLEVAAGLTDGVVVVDQDRRILYVNRSVEKTTGYTSDELIGRNINIFKSGLVREEVYRDLWENITAGRPWRAELTNRRKDGSLYDVDVLISAVSCDGKPHWFVGVQRDITLRKRVESTHAQLNALAGLASRALSDLAGPFDQLSRLLSEFESRGADWGGEKTLAALAQTCKDLGTRFERVRLYISQIASTGVESQALAVEKTSLPELIDHASQVPGEHLRGLRFEKEIDPGLTLEVSRREMERALANILDNGAWAARLMGRIPKLKVSARAVGEQVEIAVSDNGPGLPQRVQSKLFTEPVTTKLAGEGEGLGLMIAKELIRKNGGSIALSSTTPQGTTFTIRLPKSQAQ